MKILISLVISFLFFGVNSFADNIIVNGTRFVYTETDKETTIQLNNKADRPAVAQVWLDTGDATALPETIKTPFQIMPPISKLSAGGGQTIRIKLMNKASLATDKETLFWLNLLDIPPMTKVEKNSDQNLLQLAIRSRFKFFYRPNGIGNRELAPEKLKVFAGQNEVKVQNPTPFFITITTLDVNGSVINKEALMLKPNETSLLKVNRKVNVGEWVTISNINDYGAEVPVKIKVD